MDPSSMRLLSADERSPEGTTQIVHTDDKGGTLTGDNSQEQEEVTQEGMSSDRKTSEEQVSSSSKNAVQMSDNQSNITRFSSCVMGKKRDSVRKPSLRFKSVRESSTGSSVHLIKKDSQTTFVLPSAFETSHGKKDSSCATLFSHDRHSRRVRRKPSLMSLPISHCSDYGMTRQFTQFDGTSLDSAQMKRDSIVSCTSVHGTILKPSIMAQGEMFSECQRQKQWLMAIHASDPDETLPMLKKPVFLVDDGGKITKQTVPTTSLCFA